MDYLKLQGCGDLNWKLLLESAEIDLGVNKLAVQINTMFRNSAKPLVLVAILKGSFIFVSDLAKKLTIPVSVYFLEASSYSGQSRSQVQFATKIVPSKLTGRHVLLLDELFDHGDTMHAMRQALLDHPDLGLKPEDITTCTLFIKDSGTKRPPPDLVGLPMLPNLWLVGYGLDDHGEKRNWIHLYACPKTEGVPTVPEDEIFTNEDAYKKLRSSLVNQLPSRYFGLPGMFGGFSN